MNIKILSFISIFFVSTAFSAFAESEKIILNNVTISSRNQETQFELKTNLPGQIFAFLLHNPERLVIDVQAVTSNTPLKFIRPANEHFLKKIRYSDQDGILRIVCDLKKSVSTPKVTQQANSTLIILTNKSSSDTSIAVLPDDNLPDSLTKNINPTKKINAKTKITNQSSALPDDLPKSLTTQTEKIMDERSTFDSDETQNDDVVNPSARLIDGVDESRAAIDHPSHEKIIVVIDPGHGGKDPGATGPRGIREKNVVLAISKIIQQKINEKSGFQAKLTRGGDYYLTLRQRLTVARKDKADLFIAIHADAYMNNDAVGASVFALSQSGATSEAARWLADKENYSELGDVKDFRGKSYMVRSVLLDLSQTVTISQSIQMGYMLLRTLKAITSLHHNIVEQARFVVLKSPDIPSLLIETGFITNPMEEDRLSDPHYQSKLAEAITDGVINYFNAHTPQDKINSASLTKKHNLKSDNLKFVAKK